MRKVENDSFVAYSQIRKIGIRKLNDLDSLVLISHISGFLQEVLCSFISDANTNFVRYILQFLLMSNLGQIYQKN